MNHLKSWRIKTITLRIHEPRWEYRKSLGTHSAFHSFKYLYGLVEPWSFFFAFSIFHFPFWAIRYQFRKYAWFLAICFLCLANCSICSQPKLSSFQLCSYKLDLNGITSCGYDNIRYDSSYLFISFQATQTHDNKLAFVVCDHMPYRINCHCTGEPTMTHNSDMEFCPSLSEIAALRTMLPGLSWLPCTLPNTIWKIYQT